VYITLFDILILLALLGGAALGFYRGFFRQASATLVIYLSLVVATLSYRGMSRALMGMTGQSLGATDVLAFALVMIIMLVLLTLISRDLLGHIQAERMGMWVSISGMAFGMLNAAIICAVALIVIRSATSGPDWPGYAGLQIFLRRQATRSWLAYVLSPFMRLMLAIVRPWLFGHDLPPLLQNAF
jgi:membrane protein required for colicin V production